MSVQTSHISSEFIWRRVHSLMGLWLVLYLTIHLITNSQAALWIGDDGSGFIKLVNTLEGLPYLQVIEITLIGIPLAIHGIWGIKRALRARLNQNRTDGSSPSLGYSRNRAFAWQRITSWILLIGIIGHVVQMRFLDAPKKVKTCLGEAYFVKVSFDGGLYTLASRLRVGLFTPEEVAQAASQLKTMERVHLEAPQGDKRFSADQEIARNLIQQAQEERAWMERLTSFRLSENQLIAVSSTPGTAFLLMVRDTFKSPVMAFLYTLFLLSAVFHACNGLWTLLITWGIILSYPAQKTMLPFSAIGMLFLTFLGLAAIWCSYWVNLRY